MDEIFAAILGWMLSTACGNTVIETAPSPDHAHRAVLFERNCGATTSFSTQISVLAGSNNGPRKGNVFIADTDHGRAEAAAWGGPYARVEWLDDATLLVEYDADARLFQQAEKVGGIGIEYRALQLPTVPVPKP